MARAPYAIRKGFEYQDLVCCCTLLEEIEAGHLDCEFEIECDEAEHVDDIVVFESTDVVIGRQVKFHVNQEHVESFDSLTSKRTPKSKSILEKLYKGWLSLKQTGINNVRIEFVSSNPAERGRYKLGPVIQTSNGRFHEKFFQHNDYRSQFEAFKTLLDIEEDELRQFLGDIEWKFSSESIDGLRRMVSKSMRRLRFPHDDDAVSRFLEVVGSLANSNSGRLTIREFVQKIWTISRFRDACEQQFSVIDFGASQPRRANAIRVAVVSIQTLPAMMGHRYACLEEPFPFLDYRHGISATDRESLLDSNRKSWKQEYFEWLQKRVQSLLSAIPANEVDLIVFPRFSLPLHIAANVADWGRTSQVHCVTGGHAFPQSEKERLLYETSLNLSIGQTDVDDSVSTDLVVDAIIRYDRAGRASISHLESPFSKNEVVVHGAESIALESADGWINAVLLPSKSTAHEFLQRNPARPELVILSSGVHATETYEEVVRHNSLIGTPILCVPSEVTSCANVVLADPAGPPMSHGDSWEGVRFFTVHYERSHVGWEARTENGPSCPLVYQLSHDKSKTEPSDRIRGTFAARNEAIEALQRGVSSSLIVCNSESPAEFFFRRGSEAEFAIRGQLKNASPEQMVELSKTLTAISSSLERFRKDAFLPTQFSAPPQKLIAPRTSHFFNRAKEKAEIGRLLSSQNDKRVLLLYGPPGIGKKELLTEVQRLQPQQKSWIRFRCAPNSRLIEVLAQLLVRLGQPDGVPAQIDHALFSAISKAAQKAEATVIVLEDSQLLPIFQDHPDHALLLEMLAYFCSDSRTHGPKLLLVSDHRGNLQFSGSHRMAAFQVAGLGDEYVVELLQEHLVTAPCRYEPPTVDELWFLASKLHGHPFIARLAAVVLEDSTVAEVTEKLYTRIETRNFVLGRLLAGIVLSEKEKQLLEFASILRVPVLSEAFLTCGGSSSHALLETLLDRFLIVVEESRFRLHPLLVEFFRAGIRDADTAKRLHSTAFAYFSGLSKRRSLTVDERTEYVYHGVSSNKSIDLADMQMFAGSIRSALDAAVRKKDWLSVENAAQQLLHVWPYDVSGHIAMALALYSSGRQHEANQYVASLEQVSTESLWLAVEFVKSLIQRRDYDGAERNLAVVQQKFGDRPRVILAEAQLFERRGEIDKAVEACEEILESTSASESDAFLAALLLKDANRLDLVVKHLERRYEEIGLRNEGLLRLYSLGSVIGNHDPQDGLQVLADLWNAAPGEGDIVADYALALVSVGRVGDAKSVLERGIEEGSRRSRGHRSLLETFARLYEGEEKWSDAFKKYREAIANSPNHLHLYRSFARCLLSAAAAYRTDGMSAQEDSVIGEVKQVLEKLLQMAPLDQWAADAMHRAEHRTY